MPKGLTEKQVAEILGVSISKLRRDRWLSIGIPYVKFNRAVRYMEDDVQATITQNRVAISK